jgi:hypothetical protein
LLLDPGKPRKKPVSRRPVVGPSGYQDLPDTRTFRIKDLPDNDDFVNDNKVDNI